MSTAGLAPTAPIAPTVVEGAVLPPLDEEIEGLAYDLDGLHPAVDQIRDGFLALAQTPLTRDQTQTVLAALAGSEGADIVSLLVATVQRLTSYDTNPALTGPTGLDDATAQDVRRIGEAIACDVAVTFPRDLVGEAIVRIDPFLNPGPAPYSADTHRDSVKGGEDVTDEEREELSRKVADANKRSENRR